MFESYDIAIQVSELRFVTEDGVAVFDSLSFSLPRQGLRFVVGPPLSGKTLLLKLLTRELRPARGQILIAGKNILRLSRRKFYRVRERIGLVPYPVVLLEERTVEENLRFKLWALGIGGEREEEGIQKALSLTGLEPLRGVRAAELEEGQKRLLTLGVAICNDPVVLLCDDIFRDLDPRDQERMMEALRAIQRAGISILVATRESAIPKRFGMGPEDLIPLRPEVTG